MSSCNLKLYAFKRSYFKRNISFQLLKYGCRYFVTVSIELARIVLAFYDIIWDESGTMEIKNLANKAIHNSIIEI